MAVTYNGQSNNLTGEGSPNPQKLVIPGKNNMDPVMATAMLAIEQFINNLVAPESGSGGAYASLTGPGETTTPGALTQAGPFTITNTDVTFGVNITSASTPIVVSAGSSSPGASFTLDATGDVTLTGTNGGSSLTLIEGDDVQIESLAGGVNVIAPSSGGITFRGGEIQFRPSTGGLLGFFGFAAVTQTVTGSRGGNAALASLLTALANYGLIVNSSSP